MKTALIALGLVAVLAALALGGVYWYVTGAEEGEWTTRSPEALEQLKEGVDDLSRHYFLDAIRHFERALELDPEMPAAKILLAHIYLELPEQRETYLKPVRAMDPDDMNERENMLRGYLLALADGERQSARQIVDSYLEEHPYDPWALDMKCSEAWVRRDWDEAESCYRRLLDVDPNWVEAQGRLGSIAMARSNFEEAEELFRTYAYIAPDQAAPHADIGQLVTVLGRYDEAEEQIDRALAIKDDFCDAHLYLVALRMMQRRFGEAMEILDAMEQIPACSIYEQFGIYCANRSWIHYLEGDVEAAKAEMDDQCLEARGGWDTTTYRMLAMTGDREAAAEMLAKARQGLEKKADDPEARAYFLQALVDHIEGVEAAVAGDWTEACERFAAADDSVQYWRLFRATFKLRNRHDLLVCLKKTGQTEEAAKLAQEIVAVNPVYLDDPAVTDMMKLARVSVP